MREKLLKYMTEFTKLTEEEQQEITEAILIEEYKKGTYLIRQGDAPTTKCYFVLQGCVRQYTINESGKEVTANFYTEEQAILIFAFQDSSQTSKYSLTCLEDTVMVVGDFETEQEMYSQYSELEIMTRKMTEIYLGETQNEFAAFISSTPEERYKSIISKRPDLITRVPQHQLASYLGVTPESLSRIKKRMNKDI
ncbi:cyclic nucleotide-binding domain-containing protein [Oceanobacillus sp. 143]|uniref:Cyclic nucleotide-binding protein n=1 Tax=Oceanobacillus zhaokaii TaxID=2052660 RepID=A0A345PJX3_9BACI|nr:Crp/Fnr family transcriptional regulator [Oceanobacillus zhaokaii]AXI10303.1 cyclic nucleotide-binding protein [Oceanobacillus zhaokaii]QGS69356.1 cyclic nucleotide-binding domain-containing protein [Oceanobacillus sp. 143]